MLEKMISRYGKLGTIVILLVAAMIIFKILFPPEQHVELTPQQQAEKLMNDLRFNRTVVAAANLKKALRNPDSLKWESILANDDASVICMEYRAQNGFGGMNKEFMVLVKGIPSQSPDVWNKVCTKPLYDERNVEYALK